ncbi:MAG: hypothetical protein LC123_02465 [Burkholderiales bacterium]|nr:hypothetical protein [Burkholderiales bacterium]
MSTKTKKRVRPSRAKPKVETKPEALSEAAKGGAPKATVPRFPVLRMADVKVVSVRKSRAKYRDLFTAATLLQVGEGIPVGLEEGVPLATLRQRVNVALGRFPGRQDESTRLRLVYAEIDGKRQIVLEKVSR